MSCRGSNLSRVAQEVCGKRGLKSKIGICSSELTYLLFLSALAERATCRKVVFSSSSSLRPRQRLLITFFAIQYL